MFDDDGAATVIAYNIKFATRLTVGRRATPKVAAAVNDDDDARGVGAVGAVGVPGAKRHQSYQPVAYLDFCHGGRDIIFSNSPTFRAKRS